MTVHFMPKTNSSGSATAVFVSQAGTWKFAGAISVQQEEPLFGSYTAELTASLIACKQVFDLVKINVEIFAATPTVDFVYDSLSVGKQSEGKWQAKQDPNTCHAIRSLLRIIEKRWKINCAHIHVAGHSGDPGNEIVDTIASCAAQGLPTTKLGCFSSTDCQEKLCPIFGMGLGAVHFAFGICVAIRSSPNAWQFCN